MFETQSRIAESIAGKLEVEILEGEYELLRRKPTLDKDAYTYFLRAEYNMLLLNRSGIENSKSLYEKAISIDPEFVDAHIRLALAWMLSGWVWGIHNEQDAWSKTKEFIDRASKMNGITDNERKEISELYESGSYFFEWNFAPAKKYFEAYFAEDTTISYFSNNNRVVSSISLANDYAKHNGRYEEALLILKDIASRQTGSQAGYGVNEILMRLFLKQEEAALRELSNNDDLYDNNFYYLMESSQIYYYLGDYLSLDNNITKLIDRFSDRPPRILFLMAINYNLKYESKKEYKFVQALIKKYDENAPGSPAWFIALYFAHLEDREKCFEWLEKSYERHEVEMVWLRSEPLLDFIKCDPRYFDLYKRVDFLSDPPCELKDNRLIELSQ
jgi:tetratricopeptide (TPR) repeat protein